MNTSNNKLAIQNVILIILFMFAVSLFNLAGYIFAALVLAMLLQNLHVIKFTYSEILLIIFSVLCFFIDSYYYGLSIEGIILNLAGPWAAFMLGKLFVLQSADNSSYIKFVVVLSAGMGTHGILNWLTYMRSDYTEVYSYQRIALDVWRGDFISVTVLGMFFTFITAICVGVVFSKTALLKKLVAATVLFACVSATVYFANRTLLVIIAVLVVIKLLTLLCSRDISRYQKLLWVVVCVIIATVTAMIIILFDLNFDSVVDWFNSLKLVQRLDDDSDVRFYIWRSFFSEGYFIKYPFGGSNISNYFTQGYLHNMWLDLYDNVGVLPFTAFFIYNIRALINFFEYRRLAIQKGQNTEYNCLQCVMIAAILNCMVEPVIAANPYYFLILLMILGGMEARIVKLRNDGDLRE